MVDRPHLAIGVTTALTAAIVVCYFFPFFWYTAIDPQQSSFWFIEQTEIKSWKYENIPVAKSAEATLVADQLVNGEFVTQNGEMVRVFSAKRYRENPNEIGLFVHTPDRCWTEAGWEIELTQPDCLDVVVHGISLRFERRIFRLRDRRELVYFCGLVGGQALPYRLDHNLSVGVRHQLRVAADKTGSTLRASDQRLWQRVWDAFTSRRPLLGPKQFLRISTPVSNRSLVESDRLLQEALPLWLFPREYREASDAHKRSGF
jgi:hypothetical protein